MALREIDYTDKLGRKWRRGLPDGVPDSKAAVGVPLGPPSLDDLNLPPEIQTRLHNELHARGIFTERDAYRRASEVRAAVAAALSLSVQRVLAVYSGKGSTDAE